MKLKYEYSGDEHERDYILCTTDDCKIKKCKGVVHYTLYIIHSLYTVQVLVQGIQTVEDLIFFTAGWLMIIVSLYRCHTRARHEVKLFHLNFHFYF